MTVRIEIPSPLGPLSLEARDGLLSRLGFDSRRRAEGGSSAELTEARLQLGEYFSGDRETFELPLEQPRAGFELEVLAVVGKIPYGARATYGEVTARLGLGRDQVRKVAAAIGRNPLPILVACHRVIGADGSLTGYGGGLARKARLLALEAGQAELAPA